MNKNKEIISVSIVRTMNTIINVELPPGMPVEMATHALNNQYAAYDTILESEPITDYDTTCIEVDVTKVGPESVLSRSYPYPGFQEEFKEQLVEDIEFEAQCKDKELSITMATPLWESLGLITVDDDGNLEENYLHFPPGTPREDVWHWFEDTFRLSVAEDLMRTGRSKNRDTLLSRCEGGSTEDKLKIQQHTAVPAKSVEFGVYHNANHNVCIYQASTLPEAQDYIESLKDSDSYGIQTCYVDDNGAFYFIEVYEQYTDDEVADAHRVTIDAVDYVAYGWCFCDDV